MKKFLIAAFVLAATQANALEMVTYNVTTKVNAPADLTWSRIGGFCTITQWLGTPCKVTKGIGDVGTIRVITGANGDLDEMMVARTGHSYTYIQPANLAGMAHNTLAVEPEGKGSRITYTFLMDQEPLGPPEAKAAARKARTERFTAALAKMKEMAEAP